MYIVSIVFSVLCIFACIAMAKKVHNLNEYIMDIESEITKYQTHTDGAFKGAWFDMKKIEDRLNSHMHKYEFRDGILYIQEPVKEESDESND